MDPQHWQKVEELFYMALEREPDQRPQFLAEVCDDEAIRKELESLIDSYEKANTFLPSKAFENAAQLLGESKIEPMAGRSIGPYRVIRLIGYGGMGAVYLGERADEQFQKQVALKLVKPGPDLELIVSRFVNERQILANLDHSNIARLLDGGTTEEGVPYLVMEYVEGVPLNDYCDAKKLSTSERLKLFRALCSAVHYAHQNLVVHRDIKPGNILVTSDGVPKLLDFGIAKILNPDPYLQKEDQTATEMRVMTPAYASPEQIRGEKITISSDIYSLGILLYELLSGHHPYRSKSKLPHELHRAICEEEPEKPSTAIDRVEEVTISAKTRITITPESVSGSRTTVPQKLQRNLRGDLDNIVLMAMRKEPHRRYASAQQLSEDIRRHLEGLPVIARPATLRYRATKFVGRNKWGVAAAMLIFFLLIAGIISTTWQASIAKQQARIAAEERDRARIEAAKAERINIFLQDLLKVSNPTWVGAGAKKKRDPTISEVLDEAGRRIETELADQPEVMAAVQLTLGKTFAAQSRFQEAEHHLRASLKNHSKLYGATHPETVSSMIWLGTLLHGSGKYDESEQLLRKGVEILRGHSQEEYKIIRLFTIALEELGVVLKTKGEVAEAEKLWLEAIRFSPRLSGQDRALIPVVLNNLGLARSSQGDVQGGLDYLRKALKECSNSPGGPQAHEAVVLSNMGAGLKILGRYTEAESTLRESIEILIKIFGEINYYTSWPIIQLADTYYHLGNYTAAKKEAERALNIQRQVLPEGHLDFTRTRLVLGKILTKTGEVDRGEALLRDVLQTRQRIFSKPDIGVAEAMVALSECLLVQKQITEATKLLTEGYSLYAEKLGKKDPRTKDAFAKLSQIQQE